MAERFYLAPEFARHRAVLGMILAIVVPIFFAGWLNGGRLFAFPLGTFIMALIAPIALIAVAFIVPDARVVDEEPEGQ